MSKKKAPKCDCTNLFIYDDEALCLHQLFRRGLVDTVVKWQNDEGGPTFSLTGGGWSWDLKGHRDIQLAIELSHEFNVERVKA